MLMYYFLTSADALKATEKQEMDIVWAVIPNCQTPPAKG